MFSIDQLYTHHKIQRPAASSSFSTGHLPSLRHTIGGLGFVGAGEEQPLFSPAGLRTASVDEQQCGGGGQGAGSLRRHTQSGHWRYDGKVFHKKDAQKTITDGGFRNDFELFSKPPDLNAVISELVFGVEAFMVTEYHICLSECLRREREERERVVLVCYRRLR